MANTQYDGALSYNNTIIPYCPNTFKFNYGNAESMLTVESIGNGQTSYNRSLDISTKKTKLEFQMDSTSTNTKMVLSLFVNVAEVSSFIFLSNEGLIYVFKTATLTNNPDVEIKTEGKISLEFESAPVIQQ